MTAKQIERETKLYEECAILGEELAEKKGVESLALFTEKWNKMMSGMREPSIEWLEQFKKELEEAIGE